MQDLRRHHVLPLKTSVLRVLSRPRHWTNSSKSDTWWSIPNGVKSKHSYSIIMVSGLEQTRRNSAILGCLTLSRIVASFYFHVLEICLPFRPSTKPGSGCLDLGSDCGSDRTPDRIGSDRTGIFAFSAEELFWEKLFLILTQVARNRKSELSQQESNLWLVQTRLDQ